MQRSAAGGSETQQIIHDVAYDYFGRRVAVCSSDQWIRIYDDSVKTAEWKAHGGSIWRLTWAHPEFGQVLVSCSFDRKICVWEERGDTEESTLASNGAWRLARELQDSRDSVNHVTFAPKRWGLLLASCSADRKVRLHEAPDVMDLANWGLTAEFEADAGKARAAVAPQCVAWNPSPTDPLMLVIGMSDGSAILWMQQENSDGTVHWVRVLTFDSAPAVSKPPRGVTYEPLAHLERIHDLSWAPDMGRSYHLVATASRDRTVKVWAIRQATLADAAGGPGGEAGGSIWTVQCKAELPHHAQVWRVSWNKCGSMLASSVDDGSMHVYKMDAKGGWEQVSFIEPAHTSDAELVTSAHS